MGQQAMRRRHDDRIDNDDTPCCRSPHSSRAWNNVMRRLTRKQTSGTTFRKPSPFENFVDLDLLPPELAIEILKNLNATDLCLASCVWTDLANDESLWEGLCRASWGFCSAYQCWKNKGKSFKRLFLLLDEGCLTFNTNPEWGMKYLVDNEVLANEGKVFARFFHSTNQLCWQKVRTYLNTRLDVLEEFIKLQDYKNQFLPNALRKFFHAVQPPATRGENLAALIERFSLQFCKDNPDSVLSPETVTMLSYSLILLSVDLTSPHVKNKMSKREFVRNICRATSDRAPPLRHAPTVDRDFAGHLYDNVYLVGHVAPQRWDNGG